jgi:hypothetical protein
MEVADALNLVYECLLGENSLPLQLRMQQGLDEKRFAELTVALRVLIAHYRSKHEVPKQLALCMVDIYGAFSFKEGFYEAEESNRIEDAGILLQELATELFT